MSAPAVRERGAAVRFPLPPLLFAVTLVAALGVHRLLPLPLPDAPAATAAGIALVAGGVVFSLSGTATVLRHRTTVVPHRPVSTLVTTGPYRISRNPMYTGHVVACVGAALWAGSWWPLIVLPLSVLEPGDEPAAVLELISPGGLEELFRWLGTLTGPPTPETLAEMAGRYHCDVDFDSTFPIIQRHQLDF